MTPCPFCDAENIDGADICGQCGQSLHTELEEPEVALARLLLDTRVCALKPKFPVVVEPDASVGSVLELMVDKAIGCVLVVVHGKLAGIFSEHDALLKINTEVASLRERPISEFMVANVEALDETAKMVFAVHRMSLGHYRHIPIVDSDRRPVGIISARDVLSFLTE